jgi:hypothetical protein
MIWVNFVSDIKIFGTYEYYKLRDVFSRIILLTARCVRFTGNGRLANQEIPHLVRIKRLLRVFMESLLLILPGATWFSIFLNNITVRFTVISS